MQNKDRLVQTSITRTTKDNSKIEEIRLSPHKFYSLDGVKILLWACDEQNLAQKNIHDMPVLRTQHGNCYFEIWVLQ